jgi:serine/threonine protein kinase
MVLQDVYCKMWCSSGNKKIDNLIEDMQLKLNSHSDNIFKWIPYNQFDNIEVIGKGGFATVYSAIWKDGPLYYDYDYEEYVNKSNIYVALKCLHNSQNITSEFLNEV